MEKSSSTVWWPSYKWLDWIIYWSIYIQVIVVHNFLGLFSKSNMAAVVKESVKLLRHLHFCLVTLVSLFQGQVSWSFILVGIGCCYWALPGGDQHIPQGTALRSAPFRNLPNQEHLPGALLSVTKRSKQDTEDGEWGGLQPCTFSIYPLFYPLKGWKKLLLLWLLISSIGPRANGHI